MEENKAIEYKKRAKFITAGVVLLLSGIMISGIISTIFANELIIIVTFFTFLIPAIGILVYNGMMISKLDQNGEVQYKKKNKKTELIQSLLWTSAAGIYLTAGVLFDAWGYMWIVFIFSGIIGSLLEYKDVE